MRLVRGDLDVHPPAPWVDRVGVVALRDGSAGRRAEHAEAVDVVRAGVPDDQADGEAEDLREDLAEACDDVTAHHAQSVEVDADVGTAGHGVLVHEPVGSVHAQGLVGGVPLGSVAGEVPVVGDAHEPTVGVDEEERPVTGDALRGDVDVLGVMQGQTLDRRRREGRDTYRGVGHVALLTLRRHGRAGCGAILQGRRDRDRAGAVHPPRVILADAPGCDVRSTRSGCRAGCCRGREEPAC